MTGGSTILGVGGRAVALRGNDIDTDRIIPARFLKSVTFDGLERHVFADDREAAVRAGTVHPFDAEDAAGARVLAVNANFGCGSSREHAPQAMYRWGIRAMVGESFADIFFSNAVALGLPCVTAAAEHVAALQTLVEADPETIATVDLAEKVAAAGDLRFAIAMPEPACQAFLTGQWDATGLLLEDYGAVEEIARSLGYSFT